MKVCRLFVRYRMQKPLCETSLDRVVFERLSKNINGYLMFNNQKQMTVEVSEGDKSEIDSLASKLLSDSEIHIEDLQLKNIDFHTFDLGHFRIVSQN